MTRLPVWRTSVDAYALLFGEAAVFLRLGFPAILLGAAVTLLPWMVSLAAMQDGVALMRDLSEALDATGGDVVVAQEAMAAWMVRHRDTLQLASALNLLSMIGLLVAAAMATTAWCRYAATGDDGGRGWLALRFGADEIEMLGALILLGLGYMVAFAVVFGVSVAAVAWIGDAGQIVMAVLVTALFLAACRLSLLLPQVATGGGLDPLDAWHRGRGQTLRLFGIYGVVGLPLVLLVTIKMAAFAVAMTVAMATGAGAMSSVERIEAVLQGPFLWIGAAWMGFAAVLQVGSHALGCATLGLCHRRLGPTGPAAH